MASYWYKYELQLEWKKKIKWLVALLTPTPVYVSVYRMHGIWHNTGCVLEHPKEFPTKIKDANARMGSIFFLVFTFFCFHETMTFFFFASTRRPPFLSCLHEKTTFFSLLPADRHHSCGAGMPQTSLRMRQKWALNYNKVNQKLLQSKLK